MVNKIMRTVAFLMIGSCLAVDTTPAEPRLDDPLLFPAWSQRGDIFMKEHASEHLFKQLLPYYNRWFLKTGECEPLLPAVSFDVDSTLKGSNSYSRLTMILNSNRPAYFEISDLCVVSDSEQETITTVFSGCLTVSQAAMCMSRFITEMSSKSAQPLFSKVGFNSMYSSFDAITIRNNLLEAYLSLVQEHQSARTTKNAKDLLISSSASGTQTFDTALVGHLVAAFHKKDTTEAEQLIVDVINDPENRRCLLRALKRDHGFASFIGALPNLKKLAQELDERQRTFGIRLTDTYENSASSHVAAKKRARMADPFPRVEDPKEFFPVADINFHWPWNTRSGFDEGTDELMVDLAKQGEKDDVVDLTFEDPSPQEHSQSAESYKDQVDVQPVALQSIASAKDEIIDTLNDVLPKAKEPVQENEEDYAKVLLQMSQTLRFPEFDEDFISALERIAQDESAATNTDVKGDELALFQDAISMFDNEETVHSDDKEYSPSSDEEDSGKVGRQSLRGRKPRETKAASTHDNEELERPLRRNFWSVEKNMGRTLEYYDIKLGDVAADEATTKMTYKIYQQEFVRPCTAAVKQEIAQIKKDILYVKKYASVVNGAMMSAPGN